MQPTNEENPSSNGYGEGAAKIPPNAEMTASESHSRGTQTLPYQGCSEERCQSRLAALERKLCERLVNEIGPLRKAVAEVKTFQEETLKQRDKAQNELRMKKEELMITQDLLNKTRDEIRRNETRLRREEERFKLQLLEQEKRVRELEKQLEKGRSELEEIHIQKAASLNNNHPRWPNHMNQDCNYDENTRQKKRRHQEEAAKGPEPTRGQWRDPEQNNDHREKQTARPTHNAWGDTDYRNPGAAAKVQSTTKHTRPDRWTEDSRRREEEKQAKPRDQRRPPPSPMPAAQLEWERLERSKRRRNVLIRGIQADADHLHHEINSLFQEKLGIDPRVTHLVRIGENIMVTLGSIDIKKVVMARKAYLKGTDVWILDDWTPREREVQKWLTEEAAHIREANACTVKKGYMKLWIDEQKYTWDDLRGQITEQPFRGGQWRY